VERETALGNASLHRSLRSLVGAAAVSGSRSPLAVEALRERSSSVGEFAAVPFAALGVAGAGVCKNGDRTDAFRARITAEHIRRQRPTLCGARGAPRIVAGLLRKCRPVTSADRNATRNALRQRGPVVSLRRREGSKSLPMAGLRTIAKAKVDSCLTARGREPCHT